jgi:mono/diheme cytochrome c family protein
VKLSVKGVLAVIGGGVIAVGVVAVGTFLVRRGDGFSTRVAPSALEAFVARRLRLASIPARAREEANPVAETAEVLDAAKTHYADHCAICHGSDGSGRTQIGSNLYPRAPDMRGEDVQSLSDGELFFIIENGIRFTGMPGWGHDEAGEADETWKLVRLIRRLPSLSRRDVEEIESLVPSSGHPHGEGGDSGQQAPHGHDRPSSHRGEAHGNADGDDQ